jgi:hypothetical protein
MTKGETMREKTLALILMFTTTAGPAFATPVVTTSGERAPAAALARTSDYVRAVSDDGRSAVDTLTDEAARAHLAELRARKPSAFAKADAMMEKKGYARTEIVVVRRSVDLRGERGRANGIAPVQSYSNDDGEIVFYSWDDGDDGTWEGQVYVENYATGASILVNGQILISDAAVPVQWERTVYSSGGDPRLIAPEARSGCDVVQVASADHDVIEKVRAGAANADIQLVQIRGYLQRWVTCSAGGCVAALIGCRYTGPAWGYCTGVGCFAAMIGCAIAEL